MQRTENIKKLKEGVIAGIPIALGYLAVSFSLGIAAKNAQLTPFQSFLASFFCMASAGEHAGFSVIAAGGTFLEIALITLIANARYLLMSCAMSQKMKPGSSLAHRMLVAFGITDEIFGISIAQPGYLNPWYAYGALLVAVPGWSIGTALGTIAGNLLPLRLVSAFSVALYGMFLATIIPPAKKDRVIAILILVCFAASFGAAYLPFISQLSEGTRTILLTVILSAGAAIFFPRKISDEEVSSS